MPEHPPPAGVDRRAAREEVRTTEADRRGLLVGLLLPPLAFLAHLQTTYALVPWVCSSGHKAVLLAAHLLAIALCVGAGMAGWRSWPSPGPRRGEPEGVEGARLLSISGVIVSAAFAVVIVASMVPTFILGPCD
jgi:hypothetical protein